MPLKVDGTRKSYFKLYNFLSELKRRLSTSSVENDADDDAEQDAADVVDGERLKRKVDELDKFEKDSSIAHVIKQNLEEQQKKTRYYLCAFIRWLENTTTQKYAN